MSNQFIVLDIRTYVEALKAASKQYASAPLRMTHTRQRLEETHALVGGYPNVVRRVIDEDHEVIVPPIDALDDQRAKLMVKALLEENMSQFLRYREFQSALPTIAQCLRDCAIPDDMDNALAEHFLGDDLVDEVNLEMQLQLSQYLQKNPWRQWELYTTPRIMALVGGQDYRIEEYHRIHGHDTQENECVTVDISTVANYVHQQLFAQLGDVACNIPLRPILIDAINQRYPEMSFSQTHPPVVAIMHELGVSGFWPFFEKVIVPVIKDLDVVFLQTKVDRHTPCQAEIADNFTLRVYYSEPDMEDDSRFYEDLRVSLERGDWVPERDRRRLEEYERTHRIVGL